MRQFHLQDFESFDTRFRVQFFQSLAGPKSVHLIGTKDEKGISNLGVFSSVNHLGSNPPYFSFVNRPEMVKRDTLSNIRSTGFFTINSVPSKLLNQAHQTSGKYPAEISEFESVGLTESYTDLINAPYVLESPVKFGLELYKIIPLEMNGTLLVIGAVKEVIADPNFILDHGAFEHSELNSISVAGPDTYYHSNSHKRMPYIGDVDK